MTDKNKKVDENRQPRDAQTREKKEARTPWAPPSMLDAPEAPPGYQFRWIRESTRGLDDKSNMSKASSSIENSDSGSNESPCPLLS